MTGSEIVEAFRVYFDRVTSYSAPGYTDDEALLFLNNAQDQLIKDRVFGDKFQPPAFEDNQKRVVDIVPLVARVDVSGGNVTTSTDYGPNSYKAAKSAFSRLLYTREVEARISRTNPTVTNQYMRCRPIKTEFISKFIQNAANRTHHLEPKYVETEEYFHIIGDYYTTSIDYVRVSYIRKPYPITITIGDHDGSYDATHMNLVPSIHQEIVDLAVQQALQAISDPRWQTKVNEEQINTN